MSHIILLLEIAVDVFKDNGLSSRIAQQHGKDRKQVFAKVGSVARRGEGMPVVCYSNVRDQTNSDRA